MRSVFRLLIFVAGLCFVSLAYGVSSEDSLLTRLDAVLAHKEDFVNQKLSRINAIKLELNSATGPEGKYKVYQKLFDEYKAFSYDSAYIYSKKLLDVAMLLNDPVKIATAKMDLGFTLISSGMFKETLETLNQISVSLFPDSSKIQYYFLKARSYFDLSDFDRNSDYTSIYNPKGISCIDSGLRICKRGSYDYLELKGLKELRTRANDAGLETYIALLKFKHLSPHDVAVNDCCLSYIYEVKGENEKSRDLLIEAAISDIQSATKETVAIFKLADDLYKNGDIEHSYVYIKQAMDDATFYGALQRQAKISSVLPIIEAQWITQIEHQKKLLYTYSFIITLLVIFVLAFAWIIFKQLKKLRIADEIIKAANITLQENNRSLEELNRNLSTANKIKNEYIGYYFNINSIYIEKLESFQKSIDKKLSSKRYDDAQAAVKNLNLENERLQLFHTFDKIFISLFPDFINKFNSLFNKDEVISVPDGQLLTTEHRIFALIRMGIHDNDRIAKLLGYSVNTIYSYKNRIKNKSFIANDEFEDRIMEIESV